MRSMDEFYRVSRPEVVSAERMASRRIREGTDVTEKRRSKSWGLGIVEFIHRHYRVALVDSTLRACQQQWLTKGIAPGKGQRQAAHGDDFLSENRLLEVMIVPE